MNYVLDGSWKLHEESFGSATFVADLRDKRSGALYHEGAYKVEPIPDAKRLLGFNTRIFKGETAWSDAARYASDIYYKAAEALD